MVSGGELANILLELLDKYKIAQTEVIYQYSGCDIDEDLEALERECGEYLKLINNNIDN